VFCSWTLVFEVGGTRGHAIAWRHIHVEGWMKKKDLKKSCYGPKGDRKVEVLRICLGKKKRNFGEKGGTYIVLGGDE
jgi:hypothetical protein